MRKWIENNGNCAEGVTEGQMLKAEWPCRAGEPHHKAPAGISCQLSGLCLLCVMEESWQLQDLPNLLPALPAFVTYLGASLASVCFQKFQSCVLDTGHLDSQVFGVNSSGWGLETCSFLYQGVWSYFHSELRPDTHDWESTAALSYDLYV